jgi:hypothetical protein
MKVMWGCEQNLQKIKISYLKISKVIRKTGQVLKKCFILACVVVGIWLIFKILLIVKIGCALYCEDKDLFYILLFVLCVIILLLLLAIRFIIGLFQKVKNKICQCQWLSVCRK